ncbi:MAG: hypothetical protein ACRDHF_07340, partial [Tepidiformaceae bacterium]
MNQMPVATLHPMARIAAVAVLALAALFSVGRPSAHPTVVTCGPNIGGNAVNFYAETWCNGYVTWLYTSSWLWKWDGSQYNLVNSASSFCISPPLPGLHTCAFDHAGGGNGNGAGYYAVEGAHSGNHGNTEAWV